MQGTWGAAPAIGDGGMTMLTPMNSLMPMTALTPMNALTPMTAFFSRTDAGLARLRRGADPWVYPVSRLSAAERATLDKLEPAPGLVLAVGPQSLRRFDAPQDLRGANEALARVAAAVGPGVGALGAAAFAREIALGLGEPVRVAPSSYSLADWATEMMGALSPLLAQDGAALAARPEAETLLTLLTGPAAGVRLVVGHGVGAWIAAQVLRETPPDRPRRLVSFGAAPSASEKFDSLAVIGAAAVYGWSLTDTSAPIWDAPIGVGHHVNPILPWRLDVRAHLAEIEAEDPFLTARPKPRAARSGPAAVSD